MTKITVAQPFVHNANIRIRTLNIIKRRGAIHRWTANFISTIAILAINIAITSGCDWNTFEISTLKFCLRIASGIYTILFITIITTMIYKIASFRHWNTSTIATFEFRLQARMVSTIGGQLVTVITTMTLSITRVSFTKRVK